MFDTNKIYCGDNLQIMREFPDECIDLIYLDPPFFSGRNYEVIWNDEPRAFSDTAKHFKKERPISDEENAYEERNSGGVNNYLLWMVDRLKEMHRILKPTGSIYLHCDWHASHYLKVEMDKIFGYNNFRNEIVWKRTHYSKTSQHQNIKFSVLNDNILFYSKSGNYTFNFNSVKRILSKDELLEKYDKIDEIGRYRVGSLLRGASMGERPNLSYEYKGYVSDKYGWRVSKDRLIEIDNKGNLGWTKNKKPFRKHRIEEDNGEPISNIWDDIKRINQKESKGYPTQKPEALLERIIKASSNEGDWVLDPFCGCGTTVAVADRLKRRYIGIDISKKACDIIAERIHYQKRDIVGAEITKKDLLDMKPHEFQQWVCNKMLATNTSKSKTKPSGGDGGKDGIIKSNDLRTGKFGGCPIQVKQSENVGVNVVRNFYAIMTADMKKDFGFIIGFSFGSGAIEQVAKYKLEHNKDIKLIIAEDLCIVKHYNYGIVKKVI